MTYQDVLGVAVVLANIEIFARCPIRPTVLGINARTGGINN